MKFTKWLNEDTQIGYIKSQLYNIYSNYDTNIEVNEIINKILSIRPTALYMNNENDDFSYGFSLDV